MAILTPEILYFFVVQNSNFKLAPDMKEIKFQQTKQLETHAYAEVFPKKFGNTYDTCSVLYDTL